MLRRMGVRGRLLLAFLGISAFALIAAAAVVGGAGAKPGFSFSGASGLLRLKPNAARSFRGLLGLTLLTAGV